MTSKYLGMQYPNFVPDSNECNPQAISNRHEIKSSHLFYSKPWGFMACVHSVIFHNITSNSFIWIHLALFCSFRICIKNHLKNKRLKNKTASGVALACFFANWAPFLLLACVFVDTHFTRMVLRNCRYQSNVGKYQFLKSNCRTSGNEHFADFWPFYLHTTLLKSTISPSSGLVGYVSVSLNQVFLLFLRHQG